MEAFTRMPRGDSASGRESLPHRKLVAYPMWVTPVPWQHASVSRKPQRLGAIFAALSLSPCCALAAPPAVPTIRVADIALVNDPPPLIAFTISSLPPAPPRESPPTRYFVADAPAPHASLISLPRIPGTPPATPDPAPTPVATHIAPAETTASSPAPAVSTAPMPPAISVSFSIPAYEATPLDRQTVAACLVLEAASQGEFGMRAVMAVIRNRARGRPELFSSAVLRPKQFSALNHVTARRESLNQAISRAQRDRMWPLALLIVEHALQGSWYDPTGGATHYTRSVERTHWTRSLAKTTTIGAHSFYR